MEKETTVTGLIIEGLELCHPLRRELSTVNPDSSVAPLWLVSSWARAVRVVLPLPGDCLGRVGIIKKSDSSGNSVTITSPSGSGPDNGTVTLRAYGGGLGIICNVGFTYDRKWSTISITGQAEFARAGMRMHVVLSFGKSGRHHQ